MQRSRASLKCRFHESQSHLSLVMRKPAFAFAKTKTQISCAVTAQMISAFVFATWIVQYLFFLNPKFPVSSHLLWLYSPVCVGPGRKPQDRFSHNEAHFRINFNPVPLSLKQGVQRWMISVVNFFCIFEIIIFCFVVAKSDLVHDV